MAIKILSVVGTRPEAIKMAPVILALEEDSRFVSRICVTAQHRQMLDQVMELFGISPDHDLDLMKAGQDLYDVTCGVISGLRAVLNAEKPACVLVHGDTTTTFATSLASFYSSIPIGHVEAGLRTGNIQAPFPEEANRVLTARLASWHFAPTQRNRENLIDEGIDERNVFVTGNTVIDALLWTRDFVKRQGVGPSNSMWMSARSVIEDKTVPMVLITGHRRENFGNGFLEICDALESLSDRHPDWHCVYPVHLNPNVHDIVHSRLSNKGNIHLIEPLSYPDFVYLMDRADVILTDSGGVQEEAPSLGKPVLVMRETTERPEAVAAGTVKLVGTDKNKILDQIERLLTDQDYYQEMCLVHNPYGDGQASERILSVLAQLYK